ncbi:hypothetical protein J2T32_002319 [Kerstersia gyiorum]|nr:hypothetical protein [Kerstersia gyiorum]MCP1718668.1 hypothetical protein [Kerstersia gyiorum]MCW2187780.1 hypothetical protein [Kerstersia gyiorum]
MRGEHCASGGSRRAKPGSSPHARGTRADRREGRSKRRFIPACAGNTIIELAKGNTGAVHPRMRGEHVSRLAVGHPKGGSSPHARGTPPLAQAGSFQSRFIPACAGNTIQPAARCFLRSVHPRMRGEHPSAERTKHGRDGSSPHARGTRGGRLRRPGRSRFIPACAGNTWRGVSPATSSAVHPRMRGEHRATISIVYSLDGSSPHARGTLPEGASVPLRHRFIPACAGNTLRSTLGWTADAVHPRMRGEHGVERLPSMPFAGSSPHARGTPSAHPASR